MSGPLAHAQHGEQAQTGGNGQKGAFYLDPQSSRCSAAGTAKPASSPRAAKVAVDAPTTLCGLPVDVRVVRFPTVPPAASQTAARPPPASAPAPRETPKKRHGVARDMLISECRVSAVTAATIVRARWDPRRRFPTRNHPPASAAQRADPDTRRRLRWSQAAARPRRTTDHRSGAWRSPRPAPRWPPDRAAIKRGQRRSHQLGRHQQQPTLLGQAHPGGMTTASRTKSTPRPARDRATRARQLQREPRRSPSYCSRQIVPMSYLVRGSSGSCLTGPARPGRTGVPAR